MPVDWSTLKKGNVVEQKLQPWITKKVTEYFGEADETVISFVMEEVRIDIIPICSFKARHRFAVWLAAVGQRNYSG